MFFNVFFGIRNKPENLESLLILHYVRFITQKVQPEKNMIVKPPVYQPDIDYMLLNQMI